MNALLALTFWQRLLLALGVSALISFASTPMVSKMAYKVGAIDVPKDNRRMHDHPIPRLGGLAIAIAFLLSTFLFEKLDTQMQGVLLGSIVILVLGVLDDCMALPALPKFFVQIFAAIIVVMHGCSIRYVTNPFSSVPGDCIDLGIFAGPITVLWIVTMTNAVNFIDGLDGLAVGVS